MTWDNVTYFLNSLNNATGCNTSTLTTGINRYLPINVPSGCFRLPTEAEWEYMARAGTNTKYSFGDDASKLGQYAWYLDNNIIAEISGTKEIGRKLKNPWSIFDVHGNVSEWLYDYYDSSYYSTGNQINPSGPITGTNRVIRGGHWEAPSFELRSTSRSSFDPSLSHRTIGFRVLKVP
ncbi:MAG: hypothetical protein COB02_07680 [Candidatus Cloacimonadota bacterium]|nr:MAG: hypothetical protein COB02_07680 [Candidatus Cloacimonadota bacterium]